MTTDIRRRQLLGGALATAAVSVSCCPLFAQSRKQVKFLFDVLPNPKHALFYPAAKKGFFAEQGLDVTIESSKGSADVIQNVSSGAAQFGFADASARGCRAVSASLPILWARRSHRRVATPSAW